MFRFALIALTLAAGLTGCIPDGAGGDPAVTPDALGLTVVDPAEGPIVLDLVAHLVGRDARTGAAWVAVASDRDVEIVDIVIDGEAGEAAPYVLDDGEEVAAPVSPGWRLTVYAPPAAGSDRERIFNRMVYDNVQSGQTYGLPAAFDLRAGGLIAIEIEHELPRAFELDGDPVFGELIIETAEGTAAIPIVTLRDAPRQ